MCVAFEADSKPSLVWQGSMATGSSIAHQALEELWSEDLIKEIFIDRIMAPYRSLNSDLSNREWTKLLKSGTPPLEKCLYTGLKPYKPNSDYSAAIKTWKGKKVNLGCHKIAALLDLDILLEWQDPRPEERVVKGYSLEPGWHASHWWCHVDACVNPAHLLPESNRVNQERNTCKAHISTKGYRCPHAPTCADLEPCDGKIKHAYKWTLYSMQ